jgi:hypothetical protein
MQIKKKNGVRRKNLCTPSYAYLRICIFSKEITALEDKLFLAFQPLNQWHWDALSRDPKSGIDKFTHRIYTQEIFSK